MGVQSQNGHLLVVSQEDPDVYSDPGSATRPGWLVPIKSGSVSPQRSLLIPDAEIGGNRDVSTASLGPVAFTGDLDMYARPRCMYPFVKSASMGWSQVGVDLGAVGSGTSDAGMGPVATPLYLSIEQAIGIHGSYLTSKYFNVVCNSWTLDIQAAGLVEFSASMIGQYELAGGTATTPLPIHLDDSRVIPASGNPDPSVGGYAIVTFSPFRGGVQTLLPVKTAKYTVNNNIEDNDFRLGSLYLAGLTPKRREVNGTIGIRPEDSSMWRQAMWGSPAATAPGGQPTYGRLAITIVGDKIPGTAYCQTFSVSSVIVLAPFTLAPSGDDVVEQDVDFTAMFPGDVSEASTTMSFLFQSIAGMVPQFR